MIFSLRLIYLLLLAPFILYALGVLYLLSLYLRYHRHRFQPPSIDRLHLPCVTVQLPLYNERYVARRLIEAVARLDYPCDRLHVQVLDDSTDDTTELISAQIRRLQAEGLRIDLIRRTNRMGYKAGALAHGLTQTDGQFIAIFDADFVPRPDFLLKTVPYFMCDGQIGVVQGRWGHLNAFDNLLTRSQALMLDGHFAVEQFARSAGGLIFSFNGTCGLWRRSCIEDAGGWQHDTLTEDADLSIRAQIKGWRFVFVPDVVVPGEVPPQMAAFKQQQARWAKGTTQVLLKLALPLLRSKLSLRKRIMGFLQLLPYPTQLLNLGILLLMPAMMLTQSLSGLPLGPLGLLSFTIPLMYLLSQQALYSNWLQRSLIFPVLMIFSTGMVVNNSRAALSAFLGRPGEFKRTPKFHLEGNKNGNTNPWRGKRYAALIDKNVVWEIGFGLYALAGAALAWYLSPSLIIYFLLYAVSFLSVAGWSIADHRSTMQSI